VSLILDALKKLDREKSALRNRTPNIAKEILKPDLPRPQKKIHRYFIAVSLTAVATAAITYAVLGEFGFLSKSSSPTPTTAPAASQQAAVAPPIRESTFPPKSTVPETVKSPSLGHQVAAVPPESGSPSKSSPTSAVKAPAPSQRVKSPPKKPSSLPVKPSEARQEVGKAPLAREPVRDVGGEISRVPSKNRDLGEGSIIRPAGGQDRPGPQLWLQEKAGAPMSPKKPAEQSPVESATTPALKITGIVWHEDPSLRRAVVNGLFTNEGSTIEGVKVLEIHPTHVRFLHRGRIFEVSIFK